MGQIVPRSEGFERFGARRQQRKISVRRLSLPVRGQVVILFLKELDLFVGLASPTETQASPLSLSLSLFLSLSLSLSLSSCLSFSCYILYVLIRCAQAGARGVARGNLSFSPSLSFYIFVFLSVSRFFVALTCFCFNHLLPFLPFLPPPCSIFLCVRLVLSLSISLSLYVCRSLALPLALSLSQHVNLSLSLFLLHHVLCQNMTCALHMWVYLRRKPYAIVYAHTIRHNDRMYCGSSPTRVVALGGLPRRHLFPL